MKNSLFKRAFAAVAAVPLALTQCLTYTSYAVANDSTQPSAEDTGDSAEKKEAYTLKGNLLYISPDQVESTWYSDFYAELIEMGSKKSTGYIKTEKIVNSILSNSGKYKNTVEELVKLLGEDDIQYAISTSGDVTITGSIVNPDLSDITGAVKIPMDETLKDLADKYSAPEIADIDFSSVDFSGTYEIVIEGSDLADGNKVDVRAKYTANQGINGKTVFAAGEIPDFALEKLEDIRKIAHISIEEAVQDSTLSAEAKAEFDKKIDAYVSRVKKVKNNLNKVYTVERDAQADNMAELIKKINDYADKNKYVDKVDNKLGKEYRLPSSVTEMVNKSFVANIYDDVLAQLNKALVNYDVQIQSSEIAAFADNELSNLTATAAGGTYTLTGDFPDIYNVDTTLATVGLRIYREPVVTTTTTTDSTTTSTTTTTTTNDSSTTTDSTTSTSDGSTSTTTTTDSTTSTSNGSTSTSTTIDSSTSTSSDSSTSTSTSTSTNTNTGIVLNGEVKSFSVAADAEGYGFYYSTEKEFHKEQVSGLSLNVVYVDDKTEEIDLIDYFDFEASPAEKFTKNNTTFKYNVALVYKGEDITDITGRVVLANGDTLKDASGYDVGVTAYIGVKGDVNLDTRADAVDATQIQIYYARLSAGLGTTDDTQLSISNTILVTGADSVYDHFAAFLGDVNQSTHVVEDNWKASKSSRQVDTVDATNISIYYAKASNPDNTDDDETIWNNILAGNA